jgi:hypothetical protein
MPLTLILFLLGGFSKSVFAQPLIERAKLVEDIRQLADILETAHADPYVHGGGKVAFHRRLAQLIKALPWQGMNATDFSEYLSPFVAAIKDGHTKLSFPPTLSFPRALPLKFSPVDEKLYVVGVYAEEYRQLIGSTLVDINGIPFRALLKRQQELVGWENLYDSLNWLASYLEWHRYLCLLLREKDLKSVKAAILMRDGSTREVQFNLPSNIGPYAKASYSESKIALPSTERSDFVFDFIDKNKRIAFLRIDGMSTFRETIELWKKFGTKNIEATAANIYKKYQQSDPPGEFAEVLQGIPSATETFAELCREMKRNNAETLIVDLRKNQGGSSLMSQILLYFLFGKDIMWKATALDFGYEITKYSDLFFENFPDVTLEDVNKNLELKIQENDYDFSDESEFYENVRNDATNLEKRTSQTRGYLKEMTTFWNEYEQGTYAGYYTPKSILVLSSTKTFSSGFSLLLHLYKRGAQIVGLPSAQSPNCFSDQLNFQLKNSGIKGTVARKIQVTFPGDAEKGEMLAPRYQLTYEKLKEYRFDPNSEVLLALDILAQEKK